MGKGKAGEDKGIHRNDLRPYYFSALILRRFDRDKSIKGRV
jgi:hypothetical protein